jgi:hypothetical protein
MKKLLLSVCLVFSLNILAGPVSPLNYSPSSHNKAEIRKMYQALYKDELKGKDCFKRAYLWSYQLVNKFKARPIKVFFHYTNKFNRELDSQGETTRLGRWMNGGSKIVWDFHVAPAVERNDGTIIVMDPTVFPKEGPMTLQEWINGLVKRGEFFLKRRKQALFKDLEKANKKIDRLTRRFHRQVESGLDTRLTVKKIKEEKEEIANIYKTMKFIGINSKTGKTKPITCSEITHIETFDKNQETAWCFYQKASMYYYAVGELRVLNYGTLGNHKPGRLSTQAEINGVINSAFRLPVNPENDVVAKYFANGKTMYSQKFYNDGANYQAFEFTDFYLENSLEEVKSPYRPDLDFYKRLVRLTTPEEQRRLKELEMARTGL